MSNQEIKINRLNFKGIPYLETKRKCTCECHNPNGPAIMHFMACCEGGYTYFRQPLTDPMLPKALREAITELILIDLPILKDKL